MKPESPRNAELLATGLREINVLYGSSPDRFATGAKGFMDIVGSGLAETQTIRPLFADFSARVKSDQTLADNLGKEFIAGFEDAMKSGSDYNLRTISQAALLLGLSHKLEPLLARQTKQPIPESYKEGVPQPPFELNPEETEQFHRILKEEGLAASRSLGLYYWQSNLINVLGELLQIPEWESVREISRKLEGADAQLWARIKGTINHGNTPLGSRLLSAISPDLKKLSDELTQAQETYKKSKNGTDGLREANIYYRFDDEFKGKLVQKPADNDTAEFRRNRYNLQMLLIRDCMPQEMREALIAFSKSYLELTEESIRRTQAGTDSLIQIARSVGMEIIPDKPGNSWKLVEITKPK